MRKPIDWWPAGERRPARQDELMRMDPDAFEQFAVEVIKRYYAPYGVVIANTRPSADGGRDGEGEIVVGDDALDGALSVECKVWVEAKRHKNNLGLKATGDHVVAALIEDVRKIIFVASGDFTAGTKEKLERFGEKTGMRCAFINGRQILGLFHKIATSDDKEIPETQDKDVANTSSETRLQIESVRFSDDLLVQHLSSSLRHTRLQEPVFVFIRAALTLPGPEDVEFTAYFTETPGKSLPSLGETVFKKAGPQETVKLVFVLFPPSPGKYRSNEFEIQCRREDGRLLTSRTTDSHCLNVEENRLPYRPTSSQRECLRVLADDFTTWKERQGLKVRAVEAPAGHGKSRLLTELRRQWLESGLHEIRLDGATEQDEWSALLKVFTHVLPVDEDSLAAGHTAALKVWLADSGVSDHLAEVFADMVCTGRVTSDRIPAKLIGDVLASLLGEAAPSVIYFEDLHKVTHGLLTVLRETIVALARRQADLFIVVTTRFLPAEEQAASHVDAWSTERTRLLQDERVQGFSLTTPSLHECLEILRGALPDLTPEDGEMIVSQVGRSPYAFSEALHYLRRLEILQWDHNLGRDIILRPATLRERIYDHTLVNATSARIALLKQASPVWAANLIDLGACVGRVFSLRWCLDAMDDEPSEGAIDDFLAVSLRENVLDTAVGSTASDWRFDHDLVRAAVLEGLANRKRPRHRRLVGCLLETKPANTSPIQGLALLYQAGRTEEFLAIGQRYGDDLRASSHHAEAADILDTIACVLDPARKPRPGRHHLDDSFTLSPKPSLVPKSELAEEDNTLLQVLQKRIDALGAVSSGSDSDLERELSNAEMLAERHRDHLAKAVLRGQWGQLLLERGREEEALQKHLESENLFRQLPSAQARRKRAENLIRLAIARRHTGEPDKSRHALDEAVAQVPQSVSIRVKRLANLGALYFYTDRTARRRHWQSAYDLAAAENREELRIHMALDLVNLDILEDSAAVERLDDALDSALRHGLANSVMRAYILKSGLNLLEGELTAAAAVLAKAEQLAIAYSIDRRAWKIYGNMATVYEFMGDLERCYFYDRRAADALFDGRADRRADICLGNIGLRAETSRLHAQLLTILPPSKVETARQLATAAQTPGTKSFFPAEHCKRIWGARRYLMT